jgi:glucose/mannose transport system permease protein
MAASSTESAIRTGRVTRFFLYLVLFLFAVYYLLPFGIMVVNSLKPLSEITDGNMMALPQAWTLEAWRNAWSRRRSASSRPVSSPISGTLSRWWFRLL